MKNLGPIQLGIVVVVVLLFLPIIVMSGPSGVAVSAPAPESAALGLPAPVALPTEQPTEPPIEPQPIAATSQESAPVDEPVYGPANRGLIRFSRYDPKLGGPNCARFVNGECLSNMASGLDWRDYMEVACACPPEFPFWTKVTLIDSGRSCYCLDRGGKIKFVNGIPWIDFLSEAAFLEYGSVHLTDVQFPEVR